jgi:hypothetical protein
MCKTLYWAVSKLTVMRSVIVAVDVLVVPESWKTNDKMKKKMFLNSFFLSEIGMVTPCCLVHFFFETFSAGFERRNACSSSCKVTVVLARFLTKMLINVNGTSKYKISWKLKVFRGFSCVKTKGRTGLNPLKTIFLTWSTFLSNLPRFSKDHCV